MIIKTNSEKETIELGKKIAKNLKRGTVIVLTGDLGSGKTLILIDTDPQTEDSFILIDENSREYRIGVEALMLKELGLDID